MITIDNDGPDIVHTNYWALPHAARGLIYVTANAGTLRVLVPPPAEYMLDEMRTGDRATVEPSVHDARCVDLVFDDGSDTPFSVAVDRQQFDRALTDGQCRLAVWTQAGKQLDLDCSIKT